MLGVSPSEEHSLTAHCQSKTSWYKFEEGLPEGTEEREKEIGRDWAVEEGGTKKEGGREKRERGERRNLRMESMMSAVSAGLKGIYRPAQGSKGTQSRLSRHLCKAVPMPFLKNAS